jgi:hypothetical protein
MCKSNVVDIVSRHDERSHFYADDMQLYASCHPVSVDCVMAQQQLHKLCLR